MMLPRLVRAATIVALTLPAVSASAQAPRPSQRASVSQRIGPAEVVITYNRPVARGRPIFGALVPWERIWNPGADTATAISINMPIRINGAELPAGAYSIWAIPGEREWTLIFSRNTPVWHVPYRGGQDALRITTVPLAGAHMETLAFYFPVVDGLKAVLHLHWAETIVPLQIEVAPSPVPGEGRS